VRLVERDGAGQKLSKIDGYMANAGLAFGAHSTEGATAMSRIIVMHTEGEDAPAVEHGQTPKEIYISGATDSRTWNHFTGEDNRLNCGIWERSPGKVSVDFKYWEFFHLIEGEVIITNENGESWTIRKGEAAIIPAGFKGTWDTVEPVRKHYVTLDSIAL
jgi:uncharacterized protein